MAQVDAEPDVVAEGDRHRAEDDQPLPPSDPAVVGEGDAGSGDIETVPFVEEIPHRPDVLKRRSHSPGGLEGVPKAVVDYLAKYGDEEDTAAGDQEEQAPPGNPPGAEMGDGEAQGDAPPAPK